MATPPGKALSLAAGAAGAGAAAAAGDRVFSGATSVEFFENACAHATGSGEKGQHRAYRRAPFRRRFCLSYDETGVFSLVSRLVHRAEFFNVYSRRIMQARRRGRHGADRQRCFVHDLLIELICTGRDIAASDKASVLFTNGANVLRSILRSQDQ